MNKSVTGVESINVDIDEQESRKKFIQFTDEDVFLLKELAPVVEQHARRIVDIFYANIAPYPELMGVIEKADSNIDRLKDKQRQYLLEMFAGDYGPAYFERRLKIGVIHNQIGLSPRWYIGSYSVYTQELVPLILKKYLFKPYKRRKVLAALNKIISLDSQLAMDTYIHGLMADLQNVSLSKSDIDDQVNRYSAVIEKVANGDLTEKVTVKGDDNLSRLGGNLNSMTSALDKMSREIINATSTMGSTLEQVYSSINNQSAAAAEQAAAVNQVTSTLEEIKQTAQQTQEKAEILGQSAARTQRGSEDGSKALDEALHGIESIRSQVQDIAQNILVLSEHTQQIGEITNVVSSLAQQSKMLALNASIEAAKAGDAGKGFAVVASEVKALAEQSQQFTGQVQAILEDIRLATDRTVMATEQGTKSVDSGIAQVRKFGDIMHSLQDVIKESTTAGQQIVAAVRQESTGIDQVVSAMQEINKVTGQFVASSNESKQAAEQMSELSNKLNETVSVYKLS